MLLAAFRNQFPEFQQVPDVVVQANLDAALLELDSERWSTLIDQGQGFLAAHKMALSPWGTGTRLQLKGAPYTTYWTHYQSLVQQAGGGGIVL